MGYEIPPQVCIEKKIQSFKEFQLQELITHAN